MYLDHPESLLPFTKPDLLSIRPLTVSKVQVTSQIELDFDEVLKGTVRLPDRRAWSP
jgi:hypothetical protein